MSILESFQKRRIYNCPIK